MGAIEFRAWVKSENRYIIDKQDFIPLIVTNKGVMKLQPQFKENYYEILPLDWFVLEQFTGLYDKNGVKIFEGDIVKSHKYNGIIEYREDSFVINWEIGCPHSESLCEWSNLIEVIGNIHQEKEN